MKKTLLSIITILGIVIINAQTLDTNFGNQNGFITIDFDDVNNPPVPQNYSEQAFAISLQDDGKILVSGRVHDNGYFFSRHTTEGVLDTTFEQFNTGMVRWQDGGATDANSNYYGSWGIKQANDGGFITLSKGYNNISGSGTWQEPLRVQKFEENNAISLDNSFGTFGEAVTPLYDPFPGVYRNEPRSLIELSNGKLLVAGYTFNSTQTTTSFGFMVKHNTDGTLDNTFGAGNGKAENLDLMDAVTAMAVQDDGKIILVGSESSAATISRYLSNGIVDTTYNYFTAGTGGVQSFWGDSDFRDILIDDNKEYVMIGRNADPLIDQGFIVRVDSNANSTGINTTSYYTNTALPSATYIGTTLNKVHQLSNGKYIATGFTQLVSDNTYRSIIVQFNNDLSIDNTFGTNGYYIEDLFTTMANSNYTGSSILDANDNLILCGTKINTNSSSDYYVAKYSLTPNNVLVASISVQGQGGVSTITTNGGTLQMEATVLPSNADDTSYTWSVTNGTGSATIDVNGLLTATANGTVDVIATANDGSGVTGSKTITISNQTVGINNLAFEQVNIFPNPTNGILNIEIEEVLNSIRMMDLTGKTLKVFNIKSKQLDITEFTSGIYFLELANAEKKSVVKVIKSK